MNGLIVIALLLIVGGGLRWTLPGRMSWRWSLIAAGLVLLNDLLLTKGYGLGRRKLGQLDASAMGLGVQNMSRNYQTTIPYRPEMTTSQDRRPSSGYA